MSTLEIGKLELKNNTTYLTRAGEKVHVMFGTSHPVFRTDFSASNGKCYSPTGIVRGWLIEEMGNHLVEEVI